MIAMGFTGRVLWVIPEGQLCSKGCHTMTMWPWLWTHLHSHRARSLAYPTPGASGKPSTVKRWQSPSGIVRASRSSPYIRVHAWGKISPWFVFIDHTQRRPSGARAVDPANGKTCGDGSWNLNSVKLLCGLMAC